MPVYVTWENDEKTLLSIQYVGQWTWDEFQEGDQQAAEALDSVEHQVFIIGDYTEHKGLRGNVVDARKYFGKSAFTTHKNIAGLYAVGLPLSLRSIASLYNRIFAGRSFVVRTFDTLEDAWAKLAEEGIQPQG